MRTPTDSPTAPAAPHRRRTAADVKADRRSPAGPGLDTGEDRRTLTKAGTTPKTNQDHVHNADERARLSSENLVAKSLKHYGVADIAIAIARTEPRVSLAPLQPEQYVCGARVVA